jgi:tetratricopeptide (TPR) repeat protein
MLIPECNDISKMDAESLYRKGMECVKEDDFKKAYRFFNAAAVKDENPLYAWAAARSSPDRIAAVFFAWKAWNGGFKTREVMWFLITASPRETAGEKIAFGLQLLSEMPDPGDNDLLRGELYLHNGMTDSAVAIWRNAVYSQPNADLVNALGRIYLIKDRYDSLTCVLKYARSSGALDNKGYRLYAFSLAHSARFNEAKQLLTDALAGKLDSAGIWLDIAWINMLFFEYDMASENLLLSKKYCSHRNEPLQKEIGLLQAFLYRQTEDIANLDMLAENFVSSSLQNNVNRFVHSMIHAVQGDSSVLKELEKLCEEDPVNPVTALALINEYICFGKQQKAVPVFDQLPVLFNRIPSVVLTQARVLHSIGSLETALALLNSMHSRGAVSKTSLELQQSITFRLHMNKESLSLQGLLEDHFSDDMSIMLKRALLLLQAQKADSALVILDELSEGDSSGKLITLARFHALLMKKDYEKVKNEVSRYNRADPELLLYKAKAELLLQDTTGAQKTYSIATLMTKDPRIHKAYADFLVQARQYGEAALYYRNAARELEKVFPASPQLASILGKAAWNQLQSGTGLDSALCSAEEAFRINQKDIEILYTYCSILSETGQHRRAIALLKKYLHHQRSPIVLFCLGKIYKKSGRRAEVNKIYRELKAMPDSMLSNNRLTKMYIDDLIN